MSVLMGLALLVAPVPAFADGTNLLSNPGCESGTTYLAGYAATIAADTTVKRSGAASCKVTSTGGFYTLESTQSYANPARGRTFTASAWVRADVAGQSLYGALRERGGSTADRTVFSTGVSLSTTWQAVSVSITVASADRVALDFYLTQYPGSTGQVFYADDMDFRLVPTSPSGQSPSGQSIPVGDLPGWHQIVTEDFVVNAATGSWGSSCSQSGASSKIVYVGATGASWHTYPDCFKDTAGRPYRSDQVLSVHDGVLDFALHNVNGQAAGADPSPVLNNTTNSAYQTYGRYTYRFRTDGSALSEYKVAWLLWPTDDAKGKCAESDFPEAGLTDTTVSAFAHYGCSGAQDQYTARIDFAQWHTYTQEWSPGVRKYYLDGTLIGTSTHAVFSSPQRFQLQTETTRNGSDAGHLFVDWVAVYAYQPATAGSTTSAHKG